MKVAIDITPLKKDHYLSHRVRGVGFYIKNLTSALEKYYPENSYTYFTRGEKISKDIDLIHYPYFEPFFITLPVFSEKKTVVTVHDLTPLVFPQYFPSGIKGKIRWLLQKRGLQKADVIITDSESSKKDIVRHAGASEEKIFTVYLAAAEHFRILNSQDLQERLIREKYNLPERFVLYVGDATWNKNLPRLIESIRKWNIPLVLAGEAITRTLSKQEKNNSWNSDIVLLKKTIAKQKNITCLGFVSDEDLVRLYNMAAVFAMPSLYEGFGLPLLEAFQCGCPVVASNAGSIPEIVGNAAVLVDPTNINSIAEGIVKIWNDNELREKLIDLGKKQASQFSWKKTAYQTLQAYEATN